MSPSERLVHAVWGQFARYLLPTATEIRSKFEEHPSPVAPVDALKLGAKGDGRPSDQRNGAVATPTIAETGAVTGASCAGRQAIISS